MIILKPQNEIKFTLLDYCIIGLLDSSVSPADIVRVMFDSVGAVGIGEYADEVEADFFVENSGFEHIFLGVFFEVFNLCPGDGMLNIDEIFIASIFYFDEDEGGVVEGYYIEFTVTFSPVFIENLKSVFDKILFSDFLADFSCFD